jgi:protein-L-isoaspartate(D-aspartate) O-methyltransferase
MASAAAASRRFRRRLVSELESRRCIVSKPVREAFLAVPREAFLPAFAAAEGLEAVYRDVAVPTKHAPDGMPTSSSSQPAIMALMLERLDLRPGQRVLEIGAGTGYNAALLRELVGPGGQVVSVELDDDVARGARHGLREAGRKARVVVGDGHEGWEPRAPYDRIVVTASSATLPIAWRDQLTKAGLLEVPLRLSNAGPHAIVTFRRAGSRLVSFSTLCGGFMPLRGIAVKPEERTSLSASAVEQGRGRQLAEVSGPGVRALSARARRRLLTLLLDGPRERRILRNVPDAWPLALYLGLELPRRRLVESWSVPGIGVAGRDGRSLALVTMESRTQAGQAAVCRLLVYGVPEAADELRRTLRRWARQGRPGEDDLSVEAAFTPSGSRIRARWASRAP